MRSRGYTVVELLITICFISMLICWMMRYVAKVGARKGEAENSVNEWVLKSSILLWPALLVVTKLNGYPRHESWWYPVPDKPLYRFKIYAYLFREEVQKLGKYWWYMMAVTCLGVIFAPPIRRS